MLCYINPTLKDARDIKRNISSSLVTFQEDRLLFPKTHFSRLLDLQIWVPMYAFTASFDVNY